jgi:hypothetical protein
MIVLKWSGWRRDLVAACAGAAIVIAAIVPYVYVESARLDAEYRRQSEIFNRREAEVRLLNELLQRLKAVPQKDQEQNPPNGNEVDQEGL